MDAETQVAFIDKKNNFKIVDYKFIHRCFASCMRWNKRQKFLLWKKLDSDIPRTQNKFCLVI